MNRLFTTTLWAAALSAMALAPGCSSTIEEVETPTNPTPERHTCVLKLAGEKPVYEDGQTRADEQWSKGDKIHLTFTVGSNLTYGDAVYDGAKWTVNYYGTLATGENKSCKAVYFSGTTECANSVVSFDETTAIYEDTAAKYAFQDDALTVTANLKPKTGRIRFNGTKGEKLKINGAAYYTTYDASTGKFFSTSSVIETTVGETQTPYLYLFYEESAPRRINIMTQKSGFTRIVSGEVLAAGKSGYMTVPTIAEHTAWENKLIFNVGGVDFAMIPVEYEEGNFYLAETETTYGLYGKVMDSSYSTSDLNRPYSTYYSYWENFITPLNEMTGLTFRFPKYDEWLYAAKGGNKSKGYKYSGSDNIEEVGWYSGNYNQWNGLVKELKPNELGFYDMTGSYHEWVLYGSIEQYSDKYIYVGGYYSSSKEESVLNSKVWTTTSKTSGTNALRLAL